jgi:hypothetical protein
VVEFDKKMEGTYSIRSIKDFSRVAAFREKTVDVVKVWVRIVRDIKGLRGGIACRVLWEDKN